MQASLLKDGCACEQRRTGQARRKDARSTEKGQLRWRQNPGCGRAREGDEVPQFAREEARGEHEQMVLPTKEVTV